MKGLVALMCPDRDVPHKAHRVILTAPVRPTAGGYTTTTPATDWCDGIPPLLA